MVNNEWLITRNHQFPDRLSSVEIHVRLFILPLAVLLFSAGCQDAADISTTTTDNASSDVAASAADSTDSEPTFTESEVDDSTGSLSLNSELLAPGSPAAEIDLTAVVHGAPFESLQNNQIYVIEFWATWCGPCLASMPHISELQQHYQDKVQFVGVSDEDVETITEFLAKERDQDGTWADVLRYTIAVDEDRTTHRDYLGAAQQNGIPCAFIINADRKIAWIGHPMEIDEPLQAVVDETWDIETARSEFLAEIETEQVGRVPVVEIDPLEPGMDAPAVQLASIVQGPAVESFEDGGVYVVEFWATWCGPCLQSMPHISSLQEEYGEQVQFIGVTSEDSSTVEEFMQQESSAGGTWSDALGYSIAIDDNETTWQSYMSAAGQGGIPCAFIVEQSGKVAWIGHPMEIDGPLASIVDGSFDIATSAEQFQAAKQLQPALQRGDFDKALTILSRLLESDPENMRYGLMKLQILGLLEKKEELFLFATKLVDMHSNEANVQNGVAWLLLDQGDLPEEALELSLQAATKANDLSESSEAPILATLARVHHAMGDLQQAIDRQQQAVDAEPSIDELKDALEQYKSELGSLSQDTGTPDSEDPGDEKEPPGDQEESEEGDDAVNE